MSIKIHISAPDKTGKSYIVERITNVLKYSIKRYGENQADFTLVVDRKVTEEMIKSSKVQFALTNVRSINSVATKDGLDQVVTISVQLVEGTNKSRQKQLFAPRLKHQKRGSKSRV